MKAYLRGILYSFPVQLFFLHIRKYQILLFFWILFFGIINGGVLKTFGADSLFLAPEYLGATNSFSFAIVGIAFGVFTMSWNITSFILFTKHFKFLATASNPFLKYCINNSIIPLIFLFIYFSKAYSFHIYKEFLPAYDVIFLAIGFLVGLLFVLIISFLYFFGADRTIFRIMLPVINDPKGYITHMQKKPGSTSNESELRVEWYLDSIFFRLKKPRNVAHYTQSFIDTIFKRHHFAAVISVFIAFIFLLVIGYFLDMKIFQIPAAASITIFFALMISAFGAFAYFLESWGIPVAILLILGLNFMYQREFIDPRNKAYGLNYLNINDRPEYSKEALFDMLDKDSVESDRQNMLHILETWKAKQTEEKPQMVILSVSGGGHRSAAFTMNVLQQIDKDTKSALFKKTVLITGASGGMLGAAYFRELYSLREKGADINLQDEKYINDITGDLLNPMFSSFVARDLISPAQKFQVGKYAYIKDRAYSFEMKLNENTNGLLNKHLRDYSKAEYNADIPLMFLNSVITRDGRKIIISTQPTRFMMQPKQNKDRYDVMDPDAVDFVSFFKNQDPYNLRMLTALRMNATFPIVLPNVWLPSTPVVDVMDAGIRDNYGQETSLRFLENFEEWITENTSGVIIIQIRDRGVGGWEHPFLTNDISGHIVKPFFLLQYNWYKLMDYSQNDMLGYFAENRNHNIKKIIFQYASTNEENKAALSFHLSKREKKDINEAILSEENQQNFRKLKQLLND
jgi:hypothetical protein